MKCLILLGLCVEGIGYVGECCRKALRLWEIAKAHHPQQDLTTEETPRELKESIDSLYQAIVEETRQDVAQWSPNSDEEQVVAWEEAKMDECPIEDGEQFKAADKAEHSESCREEKPVRFLFGGSVSVAGLDYSMCSRLLLTVSSLQEDQKLSEGMQKTHLGVASSGGKQRRVRPCSHSKQLHPLQVFGVTWQAEEARFFLLDSCHTRRRKLRTMINPRCTKGHQPSKVRSILMSAEGYVLTSTQSLYELRR